MLTLDSYFDTAFKEQKAIVHEIDKHIKATLELFSRIDFDGAGYVHRGWPYFIDDESNSSGIVGAPTGSLSQSTTAMIVAALVAATSKPKARYAHGYNWQARFREEPSTATGTLSEHLQKSIGYLTDRWKEEKHDNSNSSWSSTFGTNDIFTLSWHLDIFSRLAEEESNPEYRNIVSVAERSVRRKARLFVDEPKERLALRACFNDDKEFDRGLGNSSYVLLRFVRCDRNIAYDPSDLEEREQKLARTRAFNRFERGLREQLSFAGITGTALDPAELAFCLEGMLLIKPDSIDDRLAERVFGLIASSVENPARFRSDTPIVATRKGEVLYPISVETATSILCSLSILDKISEHRVHSSKRDGYLEIVVRYWSWLRSRRISFPLSNGIEIFGWRSEQMAHPLIHTWETSQILEFLLLFSDYMERRIADQLLELSGLSVEHNSRSGPSWEKVSEEFEPTPGSGDSEVYSTVGEGFVSPRTEGSSNAYYSMLLYGPPGTGKSELPRNIAKVLGTNLITVTISDFLAVGPDLMENRAKMLFEVLKHQPLSVVLFDEIDQFVLDRDSSRFEKQSSLFQMLTPGMLTKLSSLYDSKNVIFALATNYEDRVDNAIKRAGRIDKKLLVLPPNAARRRLTLLATQVGADGFSLPDLSDFTAKSVLLNYLDILRLGKLPLRDRAEIAEWLDREPRSMQINAYPKRFRFINSDGEADEIVLENGPLPEVVGLTKLVLEAASLGESKFVKRWQIMLRELVSNPVQHMIFLEQFDAPNAVDDFLALP